MLDMRVDMSAYAPVFINEGYDSMAMVQTLTLCEIASLVSKTGHQKIIFAAWQDLSTSSCVSSSGLGKRVKPRKAEEKTGEEDLSLDGSYRPGMVTKLMNKRYRGRDVPMGYSDGNESSDMEASYGEMQQEEARR